MFRIIPAVDIKDGKCVQLQQGDEKKKIVEIDDVIGIARKWVEIGAKWLHIIDLDGSFKGKLTHEDIVLEISRFTKVQVGGGIRTPEIAENLLRKGIDKVIIGTLAVKDPESVRELAKRYPGRVIIAIDSRKGEVVVKGWKEGAGISPVDLAKLYEDCEVEFLYTNVDVEGLMGGINYDNVKTVVKKVRRPVIVAGGITTIDDVVKIKDTGAVGVVIGSALYTGKLKLEDLLKLEDEL
uniref:1-(5-phosphoribosyl)-5-[(5-phosphoribosylamino)methylideneamino] imidazole-4-carboxamide isomerase n=1 Tax=Geoglobus ahangari TaxID=113653 RepID=A0A7C3YBM9_9EURY